MKFKFSNAPSINSPRSTQDIMNDVVIALMIVTIPAILLQGYLYGLNAIIRAVLIILTCVSTCVLVDVVYYKILKDKKINMKLKIRENVPIITGLILALSLPVGNLESMQILYVCIISSIVAELFGKLIYGGFGYNIFNPAAVGRAFAILSFAQILTIPKIDGITSATPLSVLSNSGFENVSDAFGSYNNLLLGLYGGSIGETLSIPIIIAGLYLIYKKAFDWVLPVVSILMIAILSTIYALFNNLPLTYILVQVLSGGLLYACVFMISDPVTNPITRQGKIIFALTFAFFTYLIRVQANLPEGVVFALLLSNMVSPLINKYTTSITIIDTNKKIISITITTLIMIAFAVIFLYV